MEILLLVIVVVSSVGLALSANRSSNTAAAITGAGSGPPESSPATSAPGTPGTVALAPSPSPAGATPAARTSNNPPSQTQSAPSPSAHPSASPSARPSPSSGLVGVTVTSSWYRSQGECNQPEGACAFALAAAPLFTNGTDHGIGPVPGACGFIRVIGTQPNGAHVDDTYNGCTVNPAPSWTARSVPVFAIVLKHRLTGTWFWTATMSYLGASGTGAAVCPRDKCPMGTTSGTSAGLPDVGGLVPGHIELTPGI